jgi:hypothetical protein
MQLTQTEKYDVHQAMAKTWTQMAIATELETDRPSLGLDPPARTITVQPCRFR